MEAQNVKNTDTVKMVERALSVLDALRLSQKRLNAGELAKLCGAGTPTVSRILNTLESGGWVNQCGGGRYIPGRKLEFVLEKDNLHLALSEVAAPVMNEYTAACNQAMNLTVRDGARCYILQQSRTKNLIDYVPPLRAELPFYACAAGKILLCELPEYLSGKLIASIPLIPLTSHTITDPEVFRRSLRAAAGDGWALDDRESAESGSCIAAPVRDGAGNIIAALSFSGFIGVSDPSSLLAFLPALQEASGRITRALFSCGR